MEARDGSCECRFGTSLAVVGSERSLQRDRESLGERDGPFPTSIRRRRRCVPVLAADSLPKHEFGVVRGLSLRSDCEPL